MQGTLGRKAILHSFDDFLRLRREHVLYGGGEVGRLDLEEAGFSLSGGGVVWVGWADGDGAVVVVGLVTEREFDFSFRFEDGNG